jgi:hypothetical protein
MTALKKSAPIGREAYLKQLLDTARRMSVDDEYVQARRDEPPALPDHNMNSAIRRCVVAFARC